MSLNSRGWFGRVVGAVAVWSLVALVASAFGVRAASVQSDQASYAPGATVRIVGSGFKARENVSLRVLALDGRHASSAKHAGWVLKADRNGDLNGIWEVCTDGCVGSLLELSATGQSSGSKGAARFSNGADTRLEAWFNRAGGWGGTVTENNSLYGEGDSIPLRLVTSLSAGSTHTVLLRFDFSSGGAQRFLDAIGPVDASVAGIDVSAGVEGAGPALLWSIPADAGLPSGAQIVGGLTTHNVGALSFGGYTETAGVRGVAVTFTVAAGSGARNVVLGFSGHLAREREWGAGNGASGFPGASRKFFASLDGASDKNVSINPGAVLPRDSTPPTLQCPADLVVSSMGGRCGAPVEFVVVASDDEPGVSVVSEPASGSFFGVGTTWVHCTAVDASGNTTECAFRVTVTDTEAPTIECPASIVQATDPGRCEAVVHYPVPVLGDNCSGVTAAFDPPSGSTFGVGSHWVTATATDAAGNRAECRFQVTVVDREAPRIECPTDVAQVPGAGACGAVVTFSVPVATDNCGAVSVVCDPPSGSVFPSGTTPVRCVATDSAGNTTECVFQVTVTDPNNVAWTAALPLALAPAQAGSTVLHAVIEQCIVAEGQSRWFRFRIQPGAKVVVTLTGLAANYDLVLFKDIVQSYRSLTSPGDLVLLGAEFAPEAFSPEAFSPEAFSPEAFSPEAFSPEAFSPEAFSPEAFSPEAFSPEAFSPEAFSPEAFSPEAFSPEAFSPEAFSPEAFSPEAFSPEAFSPEAFSGAQTRSVVAISAFPGLSGEGILANTWNNDGSFYVRVRGRNGAASSASPFTLNVFLAPGGCEGVEPISAESTTTAVAGDYRTLILVDHARLPGLDLAALQAFAGRAEVAGAIVDVGADARVAAANVQADAHPQCPYAKNLVAEAIRDIVRRFRALNPGLRYVQIVGNDAVIPFYRHPDQALLANERNYVPPVKDSSSSQAALRLGYVLGQDFYGTDCEVSSKVTALPIPDLAVGRLVETPEQVARMLAAYGATTAGVVGSTARSLVTGYDFLADAAGAMREEFALATGVAPEVLVSAADVPPVLGWTADDLRQRLFGSRHDLIFLAGHFSASRALAADYSTRLRAAEVGMSGTDFENALVFSAGCHSGYNVVDPHGVPQVTEEPDWAQAFNGAGASLVAGTGYQYGDTDLLEYSERLYVGFARQLRSGFGPVAIGEALSAAKREYLANTAQMRGIHEKVVIQATLFGFPMLRLDLPGGRGLPSTPASLVAAPVGFGTNPGLTLGLASADVTLSPTLTEQTSELDNVVQGGTVTATYFAGGAGVLSAPAEPLLPVEAGNVSVPGQVARGVGFLGGTYRDVPDVLPLTGAPATEIRGVHAPFLSDVFFPVRPWVLNYFDAVCDPDGGLTRLVTAAAQYRSSAPGSRTGTLRLFDSMQFRVFYSANIQTYAAGTPAASTPALSAAPDIASIRDEIDGDTVRLAIRVLGNPAAGVQQVWIVHTVEGGGTTGQWVPLFLERDAQDSSLWRGALVLGGTDPETVRYFVQAVNGVGLVSLANNFGAYYTPGQAIDAAAPATSIAFDGAPPTSGPYNTPVIVSAVLSSAGMPLANQRVTFAIGSQSRSAYTDANGRASAKLQLIVLPSEYELRAIFGGTRTLQPSATSAPFSVTKKSTAIVLAPGSVLTRDAEDTGLVATLKDADGRPLGEKTVFFILTSSGASHAKAVITDFAGRAPLGDVTIPDGEYEVRAQFSGVVTLAGDTLNLDDPRYLPSAGGAALVLDREAPAIVVPSPIMAPTAPGQCAALVNFDVTATDNRPGVTLSVDPPSGSWFQKGVSEVVCVALDAAGNRSERRFSVEVVDQEAPAVLAQNLVVGTDPGATTARVTYAPPVTDNCPGAVVAFTPPSGSVFPIGVGTVLYTATDASGNVTQGSFSVTVVDDEEPTIATVTASPNVLGTPNHKMVLVKIEVAATDNVLVASSRIIEVTSSEPINGTGDGDQAPDWEIVDDLSVKLRSERAQNGQGRTYTIKVRCVDTAGNVSIGITTVFVPK